MEPEEFDDYMDEISMRSRNKILEGMTKAKHHGVPAVTRTLYRLLWLIGWAYMLFTSGFLGHIVVRVMEKRLNEKG